ncbi:MBL fold metallo-hydrolase [Marmoricola sp. RAF53]|uniref:MBL fold metallo-hydrolase n=1 Tax=Marmoricola sp. RAF53 TaxID=3233059 RepID=UPI003F9A4530
MSSASGRAPLALTWLGHASVVLDLDGVRITADPLLLKNNGPLRRLGPPPERSAWEGTDTVLISHLHHDHAEIRSLRMMPGVPVLTAEQNATWLRRKGIVGALGIDGGWQRVGDSPVEVHLTRADHHARPMPHRPNGVNGHLVRGSDRTLWLAGDTSLFDEIADLPEIADRPIDVAVVPIGGWGPKLSEGHMDGADAAEACRILGARYAVAVHWGTLHPPFMGRPWMERPFVQFADALREKAPDCELIALRPGQGWTEPVAG